MCHCKDLETVLACMLRVSSHMFLLTKMPYSVIIISTSVMHPLHILAMVYPRNVMKHIQLADVVCN